ncbi:ComF family protein [Kribbella sp. CA-294648]|uniref:ComF family protein n=1 Tax=Kribbella sp. CA-294648 TaxID=3239948 RepID=UPI003D8DD642
MKYVYKIYSGYDGFTPKRIAERLQDGKTLKLVWKRYIDAVEVGDEIWVYFHGQHRFENGVYVKGIAEAVLYDDDAVLLRVQKFSSDKPLTDAATSHKVSVVVARRFQQVFVLPEELDTAPVCDMTTLASSCAARLCGSCPTWKTLTGVNRQILRTPKRLAGRVEAFAPAFWVVPKRSFLYHGYRVIKKGVLRSSELFSRFKTGEKALAYPLGLGMQKALVRVKELDFDAIVPVPLSPDKKAAGEVDRTGLLAEELSLLLGVPVRRWLSLSKPISKRKLRNGLGFTASEFEIRYAATLVVDPAFHGVQKVLLVDDVCTEGSTLRICAAAIRSISPSVVIVAATAGQMAVRYAVTDETSLIVP